MISDRKQYFGAEEIDGGPWCKIPMGKPGAGIVIKDAIADITLQQVLTRPDDFRSETILRSRGDRWRPLVQNPDGQTRRWDCDQRRDRGYHPSASSDAP